MRRNLTQKSEKEIVRRRREECGLIRGTGRERRKRRGKLRIWMNCKCKKKPQNGQRMWKRDIKGNVFVKYRQDGHTNVMEYAEHAARMEWMPKGLWSAI